APWAKSVFWICSIAGVINCLINWAWKLGWFEFSNQPGNRIGVVLDCSVNGVVLGLILALILSGQLAGQKRLVQEINPN
ncbi:MAG TPA: hypothetical protein VGM62_19785, partial [Chthoniobacterales bacterium]